MAPFQDSLGGQANQLLRTCIHNYHNVYGAGSMSVSVYDTAWVSMISKKVNGETKWLFPSSFQYVLDQQESSGGWCTRLSDIDGILNTSAALLSLRKHIATPYQLDPEIVETVSAKLSQAISSLRKSLRNWDISSTNHVGFELLVPALLEMLEQEGIFFDFAGRQQLLNVRAKKLSKFKIDMLYSKMQNPALHSLEAFIGKLDFDRVSHHKAFGSMMASPSSTAAYMMHCSTWDDESESYLRHVLSAGQGNGSGGVPSAFPTSLFELTWVVTNLFQNGFMRDGSDAQSLQKITDILKRSFDSNEGLIGFAPCVFPDADDTAKGLMAMKLLGSEISCNKLVESFEDAEHFKTYSFERNPSLTTNCNVLSALLYSSNESRNRASQIAKIIEFLCRYWCQSDGNILDKWNLSPLYPMMLMSQCLTHALKSWNSVFAASANADPLKLKVYLVLVQILERAIQSQNSDGSWGKHTREETAYAILTINNIIGLPVLSNLTTPLHAILSAGRKVLLEITKETSEPEFLWIEKVTYASSVLSNSYVLAALNCSPPESAMEPPFKIATTELAMQSKFYSKLPLFARSSELNLNIFMLEGLFFSAALRQGCAGIFPRKDMREEKYLKFIPFTWTGGNNLSDQTLNAEVCLDMMVISALIYQADEFMESVVGSQPLARLPQIAAAIDGIFDKVETRNSKFISDRNFKAGVYLNGSTCFDDIIDTLEKFVEFTIYHPHISNASETDRGQLCNDLHEFLLSHLAQVEDNHRLRAQGHPLEASVFRSAKSSFAQWIRSTSANHTGGPFAFSFLLCLLARDGQDFFPTAEGKYIAQDVARHISTMCRMYNDWASIARDRKEQNLNSINFPEFHKGLSATTIEETVLKERLFRLCNYERKCLDLSMAELKKVCSEDKAKQIQVFCDVTDLYGQMYMVKDMTPAVKKRETFDQPAAEWSGKRVKA